VRVVVVRRVRICGSVCVCLLKEDGSDPLSQGLSGSLVAGL